MKKVQNITLQDYIEKVKSVMALSKEQILFIADCTVKQNKCAMWYNMRIGRTTASLRKECMGEVVSNGNLSIRNTSYLGKDLGYRG